MMYGSQSTPPTVLVFTGNITHQGREGKKSIRAKLKVTNVHYKSIIKGLAQIIL